MYLYVVLDKRQSIPESCHSEINQFPLHNTLPAPNLFRLAETKSLSNGTTLPRTEYYRRMTSSPWSSDSSLLSLIPPSPFSLTNIACSKDISTLIPTTVVCSRDDVAMRYDTPRHTYKDESSKVLYQVPPVAAGSPTPVYDSPRSPVTSWPSNIYSSPSRAVYTCPVKYHRQEDYHLLAVSPPVNHYPTLPTHYDSLQATQTTSVTSPDDSNIGKRYIKILYCYNAIAYMLLHFLTTFLYS